MLFWPSARGIANSQQEREGGFVFKKKKKKTNHWLKSCLLFLAAGFEWLADHQQLALGYQWPNEAIRKEQGY